MSRSQPRRRRIGHLDTIEVEGSPEGPTVILFHGFGADASDLAPLAQHIQAPKGTNWIFPEGHLTVPLGGHYEGRAWFPIAISELEKSMAAGTGANFDDVTPPGLKRARELAFGLLEKLGRPMSKIVLGGFSQGAMLATEVILRKEEKPAGLALLSGTLVNAAVWKELAPRHAGLGFFQSHGARDTVLSFAQAQKLEALFLEAGWQGKLQRFDGAHEIPPEVLIQLGAYLRRVLA